MAISNSLAQKNPNKSMPFFNEWQEQQGQMSLQTNQVPQTNPQMSPNQTPMMSEDPYIRDESWAPVGNKDPFIRDEMGAPVGNRPTTPLPSTQVAPQQNISQAPAFSPQPKQENQATMTPTSNAGSMADLSKTTKANIATPKPNVENYMTKEWLSGQYDPNMTQAYQDMYQKFKEDTAVYDKMLKLNAMNDKELADLVYSWVIKKGDKALAELSTMNPLKMQYVNQHIQNIKNLETINNISAGETVKSFSIPNTLNFTGEAVSSSLIPNGVKISALKESTRQWLESRGYKISAGNTVYDGTGGTYGKANSLEDGINIAYDLLVNHPDKFPTPYARLAKWNWEDYAKKVMQIAGYSPDVRWNQLNEKQRMDIFLAQTRQENVKFYQALMAWEFGDIYSLIKQV